MAKRPAPRLVAAQPAIPRTAAYEAGWRLGAIRIRREAADDLRRQAANAHFAGRVDEALSLHRRADEHDAVIQRYSAQIGRINTGATTR